MTYDAVLVVSFGGPERPEDVRPFLDNVVRGRDVPAARLAEAAQHYLDLGGSSPINDHNRALVAALGRLLAERGPDLPVYLGNRNWHPLLADTVAKMAADGVDRALAFVTAAYSSYSGCRQYREDLAAARAAVGVHAPAIDKLRVFYNHPGFVAPVADRTTEALARLPTGLRRDARLVFVTHSLPLAMARHSDYEAQTLDTCRLVAARVPGRHGWDLAFSSRSGPPSRPWLGPDVNDHLERLAADGARAVVLVPVGFVSDHVEVLYDLDVEAAATAARVGLACERAATAGTDRRFVAMIRELLLERLDPARPRRSLGTRGPHHDACPADCCLVPGQPVLPVVAAGD